MSTAYIAQTVFAPHKRDWIEHCGTEIWSQKLESSSLGLDLVFQCRDGHVRAHLPLLKMTSPVIGAALDTMSYWRDNEVKVLALDFDENIVSKCLQLIYTGQAEIRTQEEADEVKNFAQNHLGIKMNVEARLPVGQQVKEKKNLRKEKATKQISSKQNPTQVNLEISDSLQEKRSKDANSVKELKTKSANTIKESSHVNPTKPRLIVLNVSNSNDPEVTFKSKPSPVIQSNPIEQVEINPIERVKRRLNFEDIDEDQERIINRLMNQESVTNSRSNTPKLLLRSVMVSSDIRTKNETRDQFAPKKLRFSTEQELKVEDSSDSFIKDEVFDDSSCDQLESSVQSTENEECPDLQILDDVISQEFLDDSISIQRPSTSAAESYNDSGFMSNSSFTAPRPQIKKIRVKKQKNKFSIIPVQKEEVQSRKAAKSQPNKSGDFTKIVILDEQRDDDAYESNVGSSSFTSPVTIVTHQKSSGSGSSNTDFRTMVVQALVELDERSGSCRQAICDFILTKNASIAASQDQVSKAKTRIRQVLRKMVKTDELIIMNEKTRNPSFKLNPRVIR